MVTTYASASVQPPEWWEGFGLVIFDEVHRTNIAEEWGRCLPHARRRRFVLGLSGTPGEEPRLPIISEYSRAQATRDGVVAPVEIIPVPVDLSRTEQDEYFYLSERIQSMLERTPFDTLYRPPWTPQKGMLRSLIKDRQELLHHARPKYDALTEIAQAVAPPTLVFLPMIEDIEQAVKMIPGARPFHSKMGATIRRNTLEEWKRHEFPVLVAAKALDEGVNVPDAQTGILVVGSRSERQNVQRVGRIMRPGIGKRFFVIYVRGTHEEAVLRQVKL